MIVYKIVLLLFLSALPLGDEPPQHLRRGKELLDSFKEKEAVAFFTAVIADRPNDAVAYYYRGLAYTGLGKADEAIADYSQAIRIDPKYAKAFTERGRMYLAQKKYKQAMQDLTTSVDMNSNDPAPLHWRGIAHYESGEYGKAIEDFEQGQRIDTDYPNFYLDLAWALATCPDRKVRDGKRALEVATQLNRLAAGRDHSGFELTAAAYAELGKFKDAVEWQTKAVKMLANRKREAQKKRAEVRLKQYEEEKPLRYSSWVDWN